MGRSTGTVGVACILFTGGMILAGCGSSGGSSTSEGDYIEEARRYEKDFRPSDFDPDDATPVSRQTPDAPANELPQRPEAPASPEYIPGFRVQIFSSNNIDDAIAMKAEVEARIPEQWFYVVYDPPSYKLRGGDFPTRYEADRFAQTLKDAGYRDAWIVPERVYKNVPPRSSLPTDPGR